MILIKSNSRGFFFSFGPGSWKQRKCLASSHSLSPLFLESSPQKIAQEELTVGIHLGKLELSAGLQQTDCIIDGPINLKITTKKAVYLMSHRVSYLMQRKPWEHTFEQIIFLMFSLSCHLTWQGIKLKFNIMMKPETSQHLLYPIHVHILLKAQNPSTEDYSVP